MGLLFENGLLEVLLSISAWFAVYQLSGRLFKGKKFYAGFSGMDRVEWNNRVAATVHGVFSFGLAVYALVRWPYHNKYSLVGVAREMTPESETCVDVILGYYLLDVILVLLNFKEMKRARVVLIHHVVTVFPFLVVSVYSQLHFYAVICALTEATTPFTNLHWFLSKIGLRNSSYFRMNLVTTLVTYFVFRVMTMPFFLLDFYSNFDEIRKSSNFLVYSTAGFGAFLISLMSIGWFISLIGHAKSAFVGGPKQHSR